MANFTLHYNFKKKGPKQPSLLLQLPLTAGFGVSGTGRLFQALWKPPFLASNLVKVPKSSTGHTLWSSSSSQPALDPLASGLSGFPEPYPPLLLLLCWFFYSRPASVMVPFLGLLDTIPGTCDGSFLPWRCQAFVFASELLPRMSSHRHDDSP